MEGILWLLAIAGFFYFMMRFGCGAHMVHGHGGHGNHGGQGDSDGVVKGDGTHGGHAVQGSVGRDPTDPVCGMEVDPASGYGRVYEGKEYRFCSRTCLDQFDAEPGRYNG